MKLGSTRASSERKRHRQEKGALDCNTKKNLWKEKWEEWLLAKKSINLYSFKKVGMQPGKKLCTRITLGKVPLLT